jgi:hypothetical protein
MKNAVQTPSGAMINKPSFVKIGSYTQQLIEEGYADSMEIA